MPPRLRRELAEEIGVSEAAARAGVRRLFVFPYQDSSCHVWGCAFEFQLPEGAALHLQEEEVDWAGFAPMDKVLVSCSRLLVPTRNAPYSGMYSGLHADKPPFSSPCTC